jgi:hypothetical protein
MRRMLLSAIVLIAAQTSGGALGQPAPGSEIAHWEKDTGCNGWGFGS